MCSCTSLNINSRDFNYTNNFTWNNTSLIKFKTRRAGLYETIEVDDDIQKLIISHATSNEIMKLAKTKGTLTMRQDGMMKALTGVTTVSEVNRVASDLA